MQLKIFSVRLGFVPVSFFTFIVKISASCILGNDGFDEGLDDGRVEVQTSLILQLDNSIGMGFLPMLSAGIDVAVVVVGDGDNACTDGNVLSLEALGIAGAVPLLIMSQTTVKPGIFSSILAPAMQWRL